MVKLSKNPEPMATGFFSMYCENPVPSLVRHGVPYPCGDCKGCYDFHVSMSRHIAAKHSNYLL